MDGERSPLAERQVYVYIAREGSKTTTPSASLFAMPTTTATTTTATGDVSQDPYQTIPNRRPVVIVSPLHVDAEEGDDYRILTPLLVNGSSERAAGLTEDTTSSTPRAGTGRRLPPKRTVGQRGEEGLSSRGGYDCNGEVDDHVSVSVCGKVRGEAKVVGKSSEEDGEPRSTGERKGELDYYGYGEDDYDEVDHMASVLVPGQAGEVRVVNKSGPEDRQLGEKQNNSSSGHAPSYSTSTAGKQQWKHTLKGEKPKERSAGVEDEQKETGQSAVSFSLDHLSPQAPPRHRGDGDAGSAGSDLDSSYDDMDDIANRVVSTWLIFLFFYWVSCFTYCFMNGLFFFFYWWGRGSGGVYLTVLEGEYN